MKDPVIITYFESDNPPLKNQNVKTRHHGLRIQMQKDIRKIIIIICCITLARSHKSKSYAMNNA